MNYINLPVHKVTQCLQSPGIHVFDMRDQHSYKTSHLHAAVTVSEEHVQRLIKSRDHNIPILIYCYHGNSSRDLASFFVTLGFTQVYNLEGGWKAWSQYQQSKASNLSGKPTIDWLKRRGFDVNNINSRVENGMSAVMTAALEGDIDILHTLIEHNADLDLVNDDDNNALWFACFKDNIDIINKLIRHGINIDHQNVNGATVLIYAASAGKYEVVLALITAGADTSKQTLDGFNALDSASTLPILRFLKPFIAAA